MRILKVKSYFNGTKVLDADVIYNDGSSCELVESIYLENGVVLELWGEYRRADIATEYTI